MSTCLRTEGPAWTAAIGPLDYLGLKMASFHTKDSSTSAFDTPEFCNVVASCLLDLPNGEIEKVFAVSDDNRNAIWDLGLVISRVAIRYGIFREELEGIEPNSLDNLGSLYIKYDKEGSTTTPPAYILESILSLDLCLPYSDDASSKCFVVSSEDLKSWKNKNQLSE